MILAQRSRRAAQYLAGHPVAFPVLIDARRDVAKAYGVWHAIGLDALNIARPALFAIDTSLVVRSIYVAESQGEFPGGGEILSLLPPPFSGRP